VGDDRARTETGAIGKGNVQYLDPTIFMSEDDETAVGPKPAEEEHEIERSDQVERGQMDANVIARLHRELGHPSTSQLSRMLRNEEEVTREDTQRLDELVRAHTCDFCARRARRRTPVRPAVPVPHTTAPGQDIRVDVGHFRHPSTGPFQAMVTTDNFSSFVTGGVFQGSTTAAKTVKFFLTSVVDTYERVTYDLGSNFRSELVKSILERSGSTAWAVPTDAHGPFAAEKSVKLLRIELDAVFEECPEVSAATASAAAAHRLNDRATWAHDISRRRFHLGRKPNAPRLRANLFAQTPTWLPPGMTHIEHFLSLCDGKRREHMIFTEFDCALPCDSENFGRIRWNLERVIVFCIGGPVWGHLSPDTKGRPSTWAHIALWLLACKEDISSRHTSLVVSCTNVVLIHTCPTWRPFYPRIATEPWRLHWTQVDWMNLRTSPCMRHPTMTCKQAMLRGQNTWT
jgi:hypothetical protein